MRTCHELWALLCHSPFCACSKCHVNIPRRFRGTQKWPIRATRPALSVQTSHAPKSKMFPNNRCAFPKDFLSTPVRQIDNLPTRTVQPLPGETEGFSSSLRLNTMIVFLLLLRTSHAVRCTFATCTRCRKPRPTIICVKRTALLVALFAGSVSRTCIIAKRSKRQKRGVAVAVGDRRR